MSTKRKRRSIFRREHTPAERRRWNEEADALLAHAQAIFDMSANWDTGVRDSVGEGLAYIVHAAYDCRASGMEFANTEEWMIFIDHATAEWFRARGFVEWFCVAAASLFRTTPPRHLANAFEWGRDKSGNRVAKVAG